MAKKFSIVYRSNGLTKAESAYGFMAYESDETKRKKVLDIALCKIADADRKLAKLTAKGQMCMHLPGNFSQDLVNELSSLIFHTAYVVCKKSGNREEVIYLSLFKDSALRYKNNLPNAYVRYQGMEYLNPDYYVKELSLIS